MEATQLAVEWIERARAGQADQATETFGKFQRTIQIRPDAESLPLQRVDVTVEWEDDGPKQFVLSLLQRPRR